MQGLVLFNAFSKFVAKDNGAGKVAFDLGEFVVGFLYDSVCSPILGMGLGILSAMIFKYIDMRETTLLELCLYVLIMYVPFLLAEMLDLSGIVTILFTGMTARSYVVPNLSPTTAHNANTLFRLAAHLAETSIFLELGLSVFGMKGSVYGVFIGWSLLACLIGRALNVYPLVYLYNNHCHGKQDRDRLGSNERSAGKNSRHSSPHISPRERADSIELSNLGSKSHESVSPPTSPPRSSLLASDVSHFTGMVRHDLTISLNTAHMLWFSGLRGAVAYACVRSFPNTFHHDDEFIVTTMVIVLVTVFGLGSTTEAALNCLNIEVNVDEDKYMTAWFAERSQDGLILQVEGVLQEYALRTETPMAVNTDEHHAAAPGEDSIGSGFHQHDEDDHHADGGMQAGPPSRTRKEKNSVFDYGNK